MPVITLTIQIDVENYQEIVRNEKGDFLAFLASLPVLNWPITNRVDSLIAQEVKSALISKIQPNVQEKLAERGIQARVEVS
jgi:hypothetical protein